MTKGLPEMVLNNIKSTRKDHGFTIVELLVVIVVIGILAAITIVSYSGITARANAAAAKQTANNIATKAGIYQTEGSTSNWPLTYALAISATQSSSAITGLTLNATSITAIPTNISTTVSYQLCGTTSSTTVVTAPAAPASNITNPTGVKIGYWDSGLSTPAEAYVTAGNATVGSVGPFISGGVTYLNLVACYYVAT